MIFSVEGATAPCAAVGMQERTQFASAWPIRVYPLCGASIAGPATPRYRAVHSNGMRIGQRYSVFRLSDDTSKQHFSCL